jgi:tetratricopeptide (TPR) repeat protein
MEIDLTALLQSVLLQSPTEHSFDQVLAHVCLKQHGAKWESVLESVRRSLEERAKTKGISLLDAARQLTLGESAIARQQDSSLDDLPPALRAKAEQMLAEGKTESTERSEHSETYRATSDMDTENQQAAMVLMRARLQREGLSSGMLNNSVPGIGWWKYAILLLLAVVMIGAPMVLKEYLDIKQDGRATSASNLTAAIAVLERRHSEAPDDIDIALLLSHARVEKLLAAQILLDLRAQDKDLEIARINSQLGITTNPADLAETLTTAGELLKQLCGRKGLSKKQQLAALTLYGHTLAMMGKTREAGLCLDKASQLSPADPRIFILRAEKMAAEKRYNRAVTATLFALRGLEEWARTHPAELRYVPWSHVTILPKAIDQQRAAQLMEINIHIGLRRSAQILKSKVNSDAGFELGDVPSP